MLQSFPKLPMRNRAVTKDFYLNHLGFEQMGDTDHAEYFMVKKENIQLHFFLFENPEPKENFGQVNIRIDHIDGIYKGFLDQKVSIHPNSPLEMKPWGQREIALLDPERNLSTFGQSI